MGIYIDRMITARPFNGDGWSLEFQRSPGCAMSQPHRRWHVLSYYPEGKVDVVRRSRRGDFHAPLETGAFGLYPAGEAEDVEWSGWLVSALHIHISPERIRRARASLVGDAHAGVRRIVAFHDPPLAQIAGGLYELARKTPDAAEEASALMELVIMKIAEKFACPDMHASPKIGIISFSQLLDRMHGLDAVENRIEQLAAGAGLGRRRFFQIFRSITKATPHDYLVRSRLEYSKSMLQAGLAPSAVALDCGFFDQSHFANTFRKRIGLAPGAFCEWFH
ncbi:helix-turn-helix transcriptional regulator [Hyphococcus sp.]|uniref:helix-turn-helix transcriptional regulator n=1 Tax=Hyphococcus sp. TaxID=2038636 RepID=UPI003CCBAD06